MANHFLMLLQKISLVPSYLWDKMWAPVWKWCMKHCGKGVYIRPMSSDFKGLWNLSVGDGTSIPKGSTIIVRMQRVLLARRYSLVLNLQLSPVIIVLISWANISRTLLWRISLWMG